MKKLYLFLIVLSGIIILPSCSKQSAHDLVAPVSPNIINATIAPNQSYQLTINSSGNVNIEKQALHYAISKAEPDAKTGKMMYQYLPAKDYTGKEEVVLSSKIFVGSSGGGRCNSNNNSSSAETGYATTYTTIRLNIAN